MASSLSPVLNQAVKSTRRLFRSLDRQILQYYKGTGFSCPPGCGHCCNYQELEATVLEFLPLADWAWEHGVGQSYLEKLDSGQERCVFFQPGETPREGQCSVYPHRGLICRLFGYAARRDKNGNTQVVACRILKEEKKEALENLSHRDQARKQVPVYSDYQQMLSGIHSDWGSHSYPVNQAIRKALEITGYYRELGHRFLFFFTRMNKHIK